MGECSGREKRRRDEGRGSGGRRERNTKRGEKERDVVYSRRAHCSVCSPAASSPSPWWCACSSRPGSAASAAACPAGSAPRCSSATGRSAACSRSVSVGTTPACGVTCSSARNTHRDMRDTARDEWRRGSGRGGRTRRRCGSGRGIGSSRK